MIRRIVTATTTMFHENQVPKVEVHISPATETIISPRANDDETDYSEDEGPLLNSTQASSSRIRTHSDEQNTTSRFSNSSGVKTSRQKQQQNSYNDDQRSVSSSTYSTLQSQHYVNGQQQDYIQAPQQYSDGYEGTSIQDVDGGTYGSRG